MEELRKVRIIQRNRGYEYYGVQLPAHLGPRWSGASVRITEEGNSLIIQKVHISRRD